MKGPLLFMNWNIFYDLDIDETVDTNTDYVKLGADCVVDQEIS